MKSSRHPLLERPPRLSPVAAPVSHLVSERENDCIERLVTGQIAISARGIDRLFEIGGRARLAAQLLEPGEPESVAS